MNDFIYIQCPNCQTKYQVSLDVVSAGKSKAKCGHCQTSFTIKENMVNHSFLDTTYQKNSQNTPQDNKQTTPLSQENIGLKQSNDSQNYLESFAINDTDKFDFEGENPFSDDFGDEWSKPITELQTKDKLYDLSNTHINNKKDTYTSWSIKRPPIDLNGAPPYYVSTNADLSIPFEHITFKPVSYKTNFEKLSKRAKAAPYITPFVWFIGCLFLTLLSIAQYTFFNLDNLVKNPSHRHHLQSFCNILTCAIPNADISKISITNQIFKPSSIKANATDIMAAITNMSREDQIFPNIKVKIYGSKGIIGDFIALPEEYLLTPQRIIGHSQLSIFMLTVPIEKRNISKIEITPFY